jgi:hypothetical protein
VAILANSRRDLALLRRPDAAHQNVDGAEELDLTAGFAGRNEKPFRISRNGMFRSAQVDRVCSNLT